MDPVLFAVCFVAVHVIGYVIGWRSGRRDMLRYPTDTAVRKAKLDEDIKRGVDTMNARREDLRGRHLYRRGGYTPTHGPANPVPPQGGSGTVPVERKIVEP